MTFKGAQWVLDDDSKQHVLEVTTQHGLTRAAGYLKYAGGSSGPVLFRGQRRLYNSLKPALYRGVTTMALKGRRDREYNALCKAIADANVLISSTPNHARVPLLQHYGVHTKWIDVVDNVWVALWFACHHAVAVGKKGEYLHYERRSTRHDPNKFAYILLLQPGKVEHVANKPGLQQGADTLLIDLRVAAPSLYLRPHAQHGLLVRRRVVNDIDALELQPLVVGVVRVRLADAIDWMGDGSLLSAHALFPPPIYDEGYRRLLAVSHLGSPTAGTIAHLGA